MRFEDELIIKKTPEAIYNLLAKSTNFAKLVPEITVKTIEKDEDYQITDWTIDIDDEKFHWQQRENLDPELLTINYSMIEGDFDSLDARWKVSEAGEESELIFQVEVSLKSEGAKSYLTWFFARKKMRAFCKEIVQAVRDRLELSYGQSL